MNYILCIVQKIILEAVETPFEIFWEILHVEEKEGESSFPQFRGLGAE